MHSFSPTLGSAIGMLIKIYNIYVFARFVVIIVVLKIPWHFMPLSLQTKHFIKLPIMKLLFIHAKKFH